ncbi:MAG: DUF2937 family protein [Devosiaceae bacterium]|nr:DUF2937 family protein [Devosiaceae bacterium MH13]
MIARTLLFAIALCCAAVFSQAPEFAQQYRDALARQVADLGRVVGAFDAASAQAGLSRGQALAQYASTENAFLAERGQRLRATLARFDQLSADAQHLETAGAVGTAWALATAADAQVLANARERFTPAMPSSLAGLVMAAIGFVIGWLGGRVLGSFGRGSLRAARSLLPGPRRVAL